MLALQSAIFADMLPALRAGGLSDDGDGDLVYLAPDMRLMVVPIDVASRPGSIEPGVPRALFATRIATSGPYVFSAGIFAKAQYVVTADGRFLLNVAEEVMAPPITFVVNWAVGLTD